MRFLDRILSIPFARRQRSALAERGACSQQAFIGRAANTEFERDVASAVWEVLRAEANVLGFEPAPEDNLCYLYGIAEEELDEDLLLTLLERFSIPVPPPAEVKLFGSVETALDVVKFISRARTLTGTAGSDD